MVNKDKNPLFGVALSFTSVELFCMVYKICGFFYAHPPFDFFLKILSNLNEFRVNIAWNYPIKVSTKIRTIQGSSDGSGITLVKLFS